MQEKIHKYTFQFMDKTKDSLKIIIKPNNIINKHTYYRTYLLLYNIYVYIYFNVISPKLNYLRSLVYQPKQK